MAEDLFVSGHRACAGCGIAVAFRQVMKAVGKDVIVVNATGCSEIISTPYPQSSWKVPYIHSLFENVPAVASGISHALRSMGNDHTQVICIAGDGSTYDIGFGALSGMLERDDDVIYICYDNEAYMNTGIQRSSATPWKASTTTSQVGSSVKGKPQGKKPLLDIVAAHKIPYAASTTIAYPFDVAKKLKKAMGTKGARFILLFASCPTGWGLDTAKSIEASKLIVETGIWKMEEYEHGKRTGMFKPGKRKPVEQYIKMQSRFKHLTPEDIAAIQKEVDESWVGLE